MPQIKTHYNEERTRVTAWELRRCKMPDGTIRKYFGIGARALTGITKRYLADVKAMEDGCPREALPVWMRG